MKYSHHQQGLLFDHPPASINPVDVANPRSYQGLASFHKYWGKKPIECLLYLVEQFTNEGDVILDPFLGYGLLTREVVLRNRRFIGIDINPISIQLATLFIDHPSPREYTHLFNEMKTILKPMIDQSYLLADGDIASHFLWEGETIKSVWKKSQKSRSRIELIPSSHDYQFAALYSNYEPRYIRDVQFFTNSRINTSPNMSLRDFFTGRALRNIDILLEFIVKQRDPLRRALLLTLTSASGQMSNMVFAITRRGKTNGGTGKEGKIEVGSWVIGYWRPKLHFEINVWNCFENRARRFLKAITNAGHQDGGRLGQNPGNVIDGSADVCLINGDSHTILKQLPDNSVSLVVTDPPHGDRIPYLELSEMWNAILGQPVSFDKEIVVSNAVERGKNKQKYNDMLCTVFREACRVCRSNGLIVILFNARDADSWEYLKIIKEVGGLQYRGHFPVAYSANSVVQDNRRGAMKHDYVLIYQKSPDSQPLASFLNRAATLPGWRTTFPKE